jgi:hypothetical protein
LEKDSRWKSRLTDRLKGVWHEIFYFRFFHESVYHRSLSIPLGSFWIFFSSVNYISNNLLPVTMTQLTNDHGCWRTAFHRCWWNTKLWISLWIFVKIWNDLMGFLGARGKLIHEKTLSRKSRVRLSWNKRLVLFWHIPWSIARQKWSRSRSQLLKKELKWLESGTIYGNSERIHKYVFQYIQNWPSFWNYFVSFLLRNKCWAKFLFIH